jgi:DNA-binding NarL/FixJ family response regulator/signal transduction histidine kinase
MSKLSCRPRWLMIDVLLAVGFAAADTGATLGGASWWPAHPGPLAWWLLGVQAVADLSLVARRRAPLTEIAILGGFTLLISMLISPAGVLTPANAGNIWAPYGTVLAAYGPFYYRKDRRTAYVAAGTLTMLVARVWMPSAEVITIGVLRTAAGPLLALYFSAREAAIAALRERAERAERERYLLAEQARAEERARLAGEMHDVVTHRVSLMVLHAGALGITASDEETRRAAEELRAAGCQALDELRDLVGILRTSPDGEESPPAPALTDLVAESASVGTPVEFVADGDPALASPVVGRTIYRIVREALTNVRKHAPGAHVAVRVSYGDAQVRLTVTNTSPTRPGAIAADLAATGSGYGLAGLGQRIELVHGTLIAGPTGDRRVPAGGDLAGVRPDRRAAGSGVMIRVVVVDDEQLVAAHLRTILGSAGDIEVVDEAFDGAAGVEAVRRSQPDLVLMDLRMPVMDGIAAIEAIGKLASPPVVVVLTTFDADQYVLRALRAGAAGFLVKSTPPRELIGLVRVAAEGHTVLSAAAARRLVAASADSQQARHRARGLTSGLTEREVEVLIGLGQGLSNAQIASRLFLSEATVKGYVSRMLDKLGCANRTQAGLLAHEAGLVDQN